MAAVCCERSSKWQLCHMGSRFIYFMFPWPAGDPFAKNTMECTLNFQSCYVPKTKCHAKCKMNHHHWIHSYLVPCPSTSETGVHHYFFLVKKTKTNRPPSISPKTNRPHPSSGMPSTGSKGSRHLAGESWGKHKPQGAGYMVRPVIWRKTLNIFWRQLTINILSQLIILDIPPKHWLNMVYIWLIFPNNGWFMSNTPLSYVNHF